MNKHILCILLSTFSITHSVVSYANTKEQQALISTSVALGECVAVLDLIELSNKMNDDNITDFVTTYVDVKADKRGLDHEKYLYGCVSLLKKLGG